MNNKKWKDLFGSSIYDGVFIFDDNMLSGIKQIIKNQDEIDKEKEILMLIPSIDEIYRNNNEEQLKKFAPDLKYFMEDSGKKILLINDTVFDSLFKEEKKNNFINFLYKNNKKIVLVTRKNEKELKMIFPVGYKNLFIDVLSWITSFQTIDRFKEIKILVKELYNPFENPNLAYKKFTE